MATTQAIPQKIEGLPEGVLVVRFGTPVDGDFVLEGMIKQAGSGGYGYSFGKNYAGLIVLPDEGYQFVFAEDELGSFEAVKIYTDLVDVHIHLQIASSRDLRIVQTLVKRMPGKLVSMKHNI